MPLTFFRFTFAITTCVGWAAFGQAPAAVPASGPTAGLRNWSASLYGFIETDLISDSTETFNETAGNGAISRPGTYPGNHDRMTFGVRNSRIACRLTAPEYSGIRPSALVEADFMGNQPPNASEAAFFTAPGFRLRHAAFRLETKYVDLLIGQYWGLLGFQPYFDPNTVELQGIPAQVYTRTPQIRLSHTFKTEPVSLEVAVAASRPPQRDAGRPDGQGGLRLTLNQWKGLHTLGATGTGADALAIAFSGAVRSFTLPELSATPVSDVSTTGAAYSIDLLLPIIRRTLDHRGNALTVNASFANGSGFADQMSGLNGGVGFPALPGGATYSPNVDNGLAAFAPDGTLHAVRWRGTVTGLQYYFPPDGKIWISGNFSQLYSSNAADFGPSTRVFNHSWWADGNVFVDLIAGLRLGLEYAYFSQTYVDNLNATNRRFQFSTWYLF